MKLGWDEAWDLTVRTLAYAKHTLLPEALEKWPVELFERPLSRHLEIVYEINRRFLDNVAAQYSGDYDRLRRMSLIEDTPFRAVRMAHLAVVGTHSTNGVPEIHSGLLRTHLLKDQPTAWAEKAILNVAAARRFSSDRTITEYASEIWRVVPSPVQ